MSLQRLAFVLISDFFHKVRMYHSCTRSTPIKQKIATALLLVVGFILAIASMRMSPHAFSSSGTRTLSPLMTTHKKGYEVFGFAPYWTFNNMQSVDFNLLTTFAYFDVPVNYDGALNTSDAGYTAFQSQQATDLFTRAHQAGTRVVVTITQMDNGTITAFLDNPQAQQTTISQAVNLVKARGIDGINVDFEYIGDPGSAYQKKFSTFVGNLTAAMHGADASSQVTVSVLATAAKQETLYYLPTLSQASDGIFMMAYDYGNQSSTNAMPTDPLYGYKNGTYWYDVSTAVTDFLTQMPASKLILGLPWYSYNYPVYQPGVNAQTIPSYWSGATVQTYATASNDTVQEQGWDAQGEVGWKAYYDSYYGTWRMIFIDDPKSLGLKYDFAKQEHLAGVGIWALGFDTGTSGMWAELQDKFGVKYVDAAVKDRPILSMN